MEGDWSEGRERRWPSWLFLVLMSWREVMCALKRARTEGVVREAGERRMVVLIVGGIIWSFDRGSDCGEVWRFVVFSELDILEFSARSGETWEVKDCYCSRVDFASV